MLPKADASGQQAVRSRPIIVFTESLTTIGDHIMSLPALTEEQRAHFLALLAAHPSIDVKTALLSLQDDLVGSYRSRDNVCPPKLFDRLLRMHNEAVGNAPALIQLGKLKMHLYNFYLLVMSVCRGALAELSTCHCIDIAQKLDISFPADDGNTYLSPHTLLRLCMLCQTLLHPIHADFLRYQFSSFAYHVIRCRLNLAAVDPTAPQLLVPLTAGELELRDQFVHIGWSHSESFLEERGHPPQILRTLRCLNVYMQDDEKTAAIQRTQARQIVIQSARLQIERELDELFETDLSTLTFAATALPLTEGVQQFRNSFVKQISALDPTVHPLQPSPTDPDIIIAFWRLFNLFHRLGNALADILPFWAACTSLPYGALSRHVSTFAAALSLLHRQAGVSEGVHGLTGVPLYFLTLAQLLDLSREVHILHAVVAGELRLPRPLPLQLVRAWPSAGWLSAHTGIGAESC
ncbi:hypothetical protein CALVIDRAFT_602174 [Calocera viscosa TUFC12733]|uniref:Uncharacterized protein n=1 Tax=Calocera viscosa (strain TUFC12733) TaxID=1330018 RepID=A0A167HFM3_CALVF|nr:hypothetical protein CALVIDRAFT_602174 [Calocera viscosa TUFC12733]